MYGLDLFSGIGGLTKALEGYVVPVAYCEIDDYCRRVLLSRMVTGDLPVAPICHNVTELTGTILPHVDIIYGGFPCQDISVAGHAQKGLEGKRSGLFSEICRLAIETKAEWLFLENVPNIRTKGLGRILNELVSIGYDCRWGLLSASDVGAPHKRERFFLLAHSNSHRRGNELPPQGQHTIKNSSRGWSDKETYLSTCRNEDEYAVDPEYLRVGDGIPFWVDRIRGLGNAVVPAQAREAFERLSGLKVT